MKDRIKRVINNHQLSCEHTSKYFYILRGFKPIVDHIEIPVAPFEPSLPKEVNRYVLEENLDQVKAQDFEGFDVWTVTFNLFEGKLLNAQGDLIETPPLELPVRFKNLNIFNEVNPLIGVSEDINLNESEKLHYLKSHNLLG